MKLTGAKIAAIDERDRDHREGRSHRRPPAKGAIRRLAHPHVAHDVFDLDDRIVDENAGDERDSEQADEIEREADRVHRPKGRDDRKRKRDRGDDGGAKVAQEDECRRPPPAGSPHDQRLHRRVVIAEFVVDLGVDLGEVTSGCAVWMRARASPQRRRSTVTSLAPLPRATEEGDDRLVEQSRESARLRRSVRHCSQFVEPDLAAARQRDRQGCQVGDRAARRPACGSLVPGPARSSPRPPPMSTLPSART